MISNSKIGTLYIVATPIGNLKDITFRAKETLETVDYILAEDTRVTGQLLKLLGIKKPLLRYDSHSKDKINNRIDDLLKNGSALALVSDAGTPTISDPGVRIIDDLYERYGDSIRIVPIPGPSALTAALSVSGLMASEFIFLGFLPHKKGRSKILKEVNDSKRTVVLYESPHRFMKLLKEMKIIGIDNQRTIVVLRELTKVFEEIKRGSLDKVTKWYEENRDKIRGEIVVVIEGL